MNIFKLIGEFKVYLNGASFYMSQLNFILILASFKALYDIPFSAYIIVPILYIIVLIVGYIDYRYILKHQLKFHNEKNNILMELKKK